MAQDLYSSSETTLYRIGDFARYLGVTPDFLKHYENLGIIHSIQGENGYRYYRFQESNRIFECIKLKNLGFTIRESAHILDDLSEDEIMALVRKNLAGIRREFEFRRALLDTYDGFEEEIGYTAAQDSDWMIVNTEAMLFLPHSQARAFLGAPEIYEILPEWMNAIPMVRSAAWIDPTPPEDYSLPSASILRTWGLTVPKKMAERLHLPVNARVLELPPCKAMHCYFSARIPPDSDRPVNYYSVWKKLDELHLQPGGPILGINNIGAHSNGLLGINQHYIVPLKNA